MNSSCEGHGGDSKLTSPKLKDYLKVTFNLFGGCKGPGISSLIFLFPWDMPASHKVFFQVMFDVLFLFCFPGIHDLQRLIQHHLLEVLDILYQAPKFANPFHIILVMVVHNPQPQIGVNVAFRDVQRSLQMLGVQNGRLSLSLKKTSF